MSESRRLRWKCRRGMLELDLVLNAFLDAQYPDLSEIQKQQFEALLEEGDEALWAMISDINHEVPRRYAQLLAGLRACSI